MCVKEFPVKTFHGSLSTMTIAVLCRTNRNLNATSYVGIGFDVSQKVCNRVGKCAIEKILELCVTENRK